MTNPFTARQWHFLAGIVALLCGFLFYFLIRPSAPSYGLPESVVASFPSFIHMLALTSLSFAIGFGNRWKTLRLITLLLGVCLIAEISFGYVDAFDVLAALLGTGVGIGIGILTNTLSADEVDKANHQTRTRGEVALFSLSLVMITGCYYGPGYQGIDYNVSTPVYTTYAELRSSTSVTSAKELQDIGRLYLFGDYVFLNRRNEGIHIIDNSDPSNPINSGFISIPGNTEISIRSGYLYADSYVDLVTFDIRNINNIQEINRQIDIFPWDAYQNVPDDVYFSQSDIDSTRGVVTSYVR